MGWLDSLSDFDWGGLASGLGSVASVAGAGWDIYQGYQNQKLANKYADLAFGSMEAQDAYAAEMYERQKQKYWPLEDLQIQYTMEDLQNLRPLAQAQVQYASDRGLADIAKNRELDPLYDETEKSLIRKLTEGEDVLRDRMMNEASANVAASYAQQREQDKRTMGMAGINPNSGAFANYLSRTGTNQALAEAMGRTQASRQAEDLALSRQSQALNYRKGASLPSYQFTPSVSSSSVASGLGGVTSGAANLAGQYNQSAQAGWSSAWSLLQGLSDNKS